MLARIAELEEEIARLSGMTEEVEDRLDGAIGEIRAALALRRIAMPLVNVMVNGRAYTIACDDGEEDHLRELAAHVDAKVREVLELGGPGGRSAPAADGGAADRRRTSRSRGAQLEAPCASELAAIMPSTRMRTSAKSWRPKPKAIAADALEARAPKRARGHCRQRFAHA